LGEGFAAVLDQHAAILRLALAEGGGVEVSTHGDAFFVAFRSPLGAVRAAVAAQRALAAHDWAPAPPAKVRMGLHTGEAVLREARTAAGEELPDGTRLLPLTGPGGSGKSRLAIQVAEDLLPRFEDGSCFVDLAPVTDPALVPAAVAKALGVKESAGRPVLEEV